MSTNSQTSHRGFQRKYRKKAGAYVNMNRGGYMEDTFYKVSSMCLLFILLSFSTLSPQCTVLFLRKLQKSILFVFSPGEVIYNILCNGLNAIHFHDMI